DPWRQVINDNHITPGSADAHYRVVDDVVIERLGDTMVTVQLGTDRILELNDTAARLVELLADGKTAGEAATIIADEYSVPLPEVTANVQSTVAQLVEERILEAAGA